MSLKTTDKIRIKLKSFNNELLNSSCQKILNLLQEAQMKSIGMISLPTQKRIYCVLRSPHVDKDSREHFEIRIHKRMIEVYYDSGTQIFELLSKIDFPIGVFYKIDFS